MSLRIKILATGSTGNATVLVAGCGESSTTLLIDAGLSPRAVRLRLEAESLSLGDLDGIVLTHLDHDHFRRSWIKASRRLGLPIYCAPRHARRLFRETLRQDSVNIVDDAFSIGEVQAEPSSLAHDALGTTAFVFEHGGARIGFATDLGRVPQSLIERFRDLDVLAIESNYDARMQMASGRPDYLKRRIMGGAGHLSNAQCLDAVRAIAARSRLSRIVLVHLSQDCNCPTVVDRLYRDRAPELHPILTIARHGSETDWIDVEPRERASTTDDAYTEFLFA